MPPFIKDDIKKKDEQRLNEMQREIDEAVQQPKIDEDVIKSDVDENENVFGLEDNVTNDTDKAEISNEGKLIAEVARLTDELKETESSLKRLRADFENYRRRTVKEKEELSDFVSANILKDMLPLIDNFERAMATENTDIANFQKGIEMIYSQFAETLKKHGLSAIEIGEDTVFDPNFHQAVMRIENSDLPDGSIAQVLQTGYMVKDKVIRPSMVQVVGN